VRTGRRRAQQDGGVGPNAMLAFKAEPTACLGPPACMMGVCRLAPRNEARHGRPPVAVDPLGPPRMPK